MWIADQIIWAYILWIVYELPCFVLLCFVLDIPQCFFTTKILHVNELLNLVIIISKANWMKKELISHSHCIQLSIHSCFYLLLLFYFISWFHFILLIIVFIFLLPNANLMKKGPILHWHFTWPSKWTESKKFFFYQFFFQLSVHTQLMFIFCLVSL